MTAAEGAQNRTFTFDNRGFLVKESHPETGVTTYDTYDVYGHALHRLQGTADGPFDLRFVYDVYQRLAEVRQGASGQTLVKQMTYDTLPAGDPGAPYSENGQLVKSYRRNFHAELGGDVGVNSYFHYDTTGRLDQKTTSIGSGPSFTHHYAYDVLGEVTSLQYPTCNTCAPIAGGAAIPARTIDFRWSHGYLAGVDQGQTHFTSSNPITYWPNGMIQNITHVAADGSNPVTDSQTLDQGMARPDVITFSGASSCPVPSLPVITPAPASLCTAQSGTASVPGQQGATFTWSIEGGTITANTGLSIAYTATSTTSVLLHVVAANSCGSSALATASVSVTAGTTIQQQPQNATITSGSTTTLHVAATGTGLSYQWYRGNSGDQSNAVAGATAADFTTPPLTATTTYSVKVVAQCGTANSVSATVTINLLLQPASVPRRSKRRLRAAPTRW